MTKIDNFFTGGHHFTELESDLKSKFQMLINALLLSSMALLYAVISNIYRETYGIVPIEVSLIIINIVLFFILRKNRSAFSFVSKMITTQYSLLFLYLFYAYEPNELKHLWLFTYPIILLYFENNKSSVYWLMFMIAMLFLSTVQPFVETYYSLYQVFYLSVVLLVVIAIIYFYKQKMDEAKAVIVRQQESLHSFNTELEKKVTEKTHELQELNDCLEIKVQEKIQELIDKDKLLTVQSKQAVMGEMISMIAHQWRQPLSTVTLQISNLQIRKILGEELDSETVDKVLEEISQNIIYLSETIDDFKTYFHPEKEKSSIGVNVLLQRAVSFVLPRLKGTKILFEFNPKEEIIIQTYANELIQVVLNLLNNAVDALSELDKERLIVEISAEKEDEYIVIYVKDNGAGINEENIHHIFEPYFSTKGKNGTGLGLYMSQMIIEKQFNGVINVQSSEKGSEFSVKIPRSLA